MKTTLRLGSLLGIVALILHSCGFEDDSLNRPLETTKKQEGTNYQNCEGLLRSPEDFEGKTIRLDAINWGSSPSIDGDEILMRLGDEKFEGMQQAHILVHFSKEQATEINHIKENESIKLIATVGGYESGALRLLDAKIL